MSKWLTQKVSAEGFTTVVSANYAISGTTDIPISVEPGGLFIAGWTIKIELQRYVDSGSGVGGGWSTIGTRTLRIAERSHVSDRFNGVRKSTAQMRLKTTWINKQFLSSRFVHR